jgi:hypothetical protein
MTRRCDAVGGVSGEDEDDDESPFDDDGSPSERTGNAGRSRSGEDEEDGDASPLVARVVVDTETHVDDEL